MVVLFRTGERGRLTDIFMSESRVDFRTILSGARGVNVVDMDELDELNEDADLEFDDAEDDYGQ